MVFTVAHYNNFKIIKFTVFVRGGEGEEGATKSEQV